MNVFLLLVALQLNIFIRQKKPLQKSDLVNGRRRIDTFSKNQNLSTENEVNSTQKMKNFLKESTVTK
jgi:hypothetical protein